MKRLLFITFLSFLSTGLVSCSNKSKSKSAFKITLGNLAIISSGGAYVNFIDLKNPVSNIVKLDADNTATVPTGAYHLIAVAFKGPAANSGDMLCGSIPEANISSAEITFTLNVSASECMLPKYSKTILELKKGITSKWNIDRFDLSHWGQ